MNHFQCKPTKIFSNIDIIRRWRIVINSRRPFILFSMYTSETHKEDDFLPKRCILIHLKPCIHFITVILKLQGVDLKHLRHFQW